MLQRVYGRSSHIAEGNWRLVLSLNLGANDKPAPSRNPSQRMSTNDAPPEVAAVILPSKFSSCVRSCKVNIEKNSTANVWSGHLYARSAHTQNSNSANKLSRATITTIQSTPTELWMRTAAIYASPKSVTYW